MTTLTAIRSNGRPAAQHGAECLRQALTASRHLPLQARLDSFSAFLEHAIPDIARHYGRPVASATGREILVADPAGGVPRPMVMFGSNNYLGLANHPDVRSAVSRAVERWGVGISGPPLLNGTLLMHRELEARLAAFKGQEDAIIFPTGYGANLGLVSALMRPGDRVIYDERHHASFIDGCRLSGADTVTFAHNDVKALKAKLGLPRASGDMMVGVEGVYSMDGDLAPLAAMTPLCRKAGALLVVDDAHGTGVIGPGGRGAAALAGVEHEVDAVMGTFSKVFGVVGGFVAGNRALMAWLRFFARSYGFSASLPPAVIAAVLAGLDIIERDPEPRERLWRNVAGLRRRLNDIGVAWAGVSPICPLPIPPGVDFARAANHFEAAGLFVNAIGYPAVPVGHACFRISLSAEHTDEDLDRVVHTYATLEGTG